MIVIIVQSPLLSKAPANPYELRADLQSSQLSALNSSRPAEEGQKQREKRRTRKERGSWTELQGGAVINVVCRVQRQVYPVVSR